MEEARAPLLAKGRGTAQNSGELRSQEGLECQAELLLVGGAALCTPGAFV